MHLNIEFKCKNMMLYLSGKKTFFKIFSGLSALMMVVNMSFLGVFFVGALDADAFHVEPGGKIEIKKFARLAGDTQFFFSSTLGDFSLKDSEDFVFHLGTGLYSFTEQATPGWSLYDLTCRGDRESDVEIDIASGNLTVDLVDGEFVKCFFYNEPTELPEMGSITVEKYLDEDGLASTTNDRVLADTGEWTFDMTGDATSTEQTVSGIAQFLNLDVGTYSVSEDIPDGYELIEPDSNEIIVDLSQGQHQVVEFVNFLPELPLFGSITINKYIDQDGVASTTDDRDLATSTSWTFNLYDGVATSTQATVSGVTVFSGLEAGEYHISEEVLLGYVLLEPADNDVMVILSEGEDFELDYINYRTEEPIFGSITVRKYRDTDGLASTTDDRALSEVAWTFNLSGNATSSDVTVGGTVVFGNLGPGDYTITENLLSGWQFVDPANGIATTTLIEGENITIDFVNFQEETPTNGGGGGGSSSSGGGSSSSGGGSGIIPFELLDTTAGNSTCDSITIDWRTNKLADSRVIYDVESHSDISGETEPNYGYAFSTELNTGEVSGHSMTVTGLIYGTTYYFRPVSHENSNEILGNEVSFATLPAELCVAGEEGEPILAISKEVDRESARAGDQDIEYTVDILNAGNLTAFNVVLTETLPVGLSFADGTENPREIMIGDILPDETKTIVFLVDVDSNAKAEVHTNTVSAVADNHGKVSDTADLDIIESRVLAAAGYSVMDMIVVIALIVSSTGSALWLRRKIV